MIARCSTRYAGTCRDWIRLLDDSPTNEHVETAVCGGLGPGVAFDKVRTTCYGLGHPFPFLRTVGTSFSSTTSTHHGYSRPLYFPLDGLKVQPCSCSRNTCLSLVLGGLIQLCPLHCRGLIHYSCSSLMDVWRPADRCAIVSSYFILICCSHSASAHQLFVSHGPPTSISRAVASHGLYSLPQRSRNCCVRG